MAAQLLAAGFACPSTREPNGKIVGKNAPDPVQFRTKKTRTISYLASISNFIGIGKMYREIHEFEPMLPSDRLMAELYPVAERIVVASVKLTSAAHAATRDAMRELVRQMNSYYSNRIEGRSTHPINIARALQHDFSSRPDEARLQRIALAHIKAEQALKLRLEAASSLQSAFLIAAHREMYERLAMSDRLSDDGIEIVPGQLRVQEVKVSRHIPPVASSLPRFLERMDQRYVESQNRIRNLIVAACVHHRGAWVHPFLDGNGRATRLQSHCALWQLSGGLWSHSRGFARSVQAYYTALHNADQPRQGQYDGRGPLSEKGLLGWIQYFLGVCEDQVLFMSRMLDLDGMRQRIAALMAQQYRREAAAPLFHVFGLGPVPRGEFSQMTGLAERTARNLMAQLLKDGLLVSDSRVGPVRFGMPLAALNTLFPSLYPEVNLPFAAR
jgi:Fic family protein